MVVLNFTSGPQLEPWTQAQKKQRTHTHKLWNAQTHDSKFRIIIKTPFRIHTSNPKRITKVARSFMKAAINTQWHKHINNEMLSRFIIIFQTQELNITSSPPHKYERAQKMSQQAHKAEKKQTVNKGHQSFLKFVWLPSPFFALLHLSSFHLSTSSGVS